MRPWPGSSASKIRAVRSPCSARCRSRQLTERLSSPSAYQRMWKSCSSNDQSPALRRELVPGQPPRLFEPEAVGIGVARDRCSSASSSRADTGVEVRREPDTRPRPLPLSPLSLARERAAPARDAGGRPFFRRPRARRRRDALRTRRRSLRRGRHRPRRRREGGVDDRDLRRVDGELAGEASRRAASASAFRPLSSLKSAKTPSTGWTPAATAPARHSERASR